MKILLVVVLVSLLLVIVGLKVMAKRSENSPRLGLVEGQLRPCPTAARNCVASEPAAGMSAGGGPPLWLIKPIDYQGDADVAWRRLQKIVRDAGGRVHEQDRGYLWVSFRSHWFGFVDDMEFRLDAGGRRIHLRSASRTGYSDFGVNRGRVESIRRLFDRENT